MAGWQDDAIVSPRGGKKEPWEADAIAVSATQANLRPGQRTSSGVMEAVQAGWESSGTGLAARRKLPEVVLDPHHAKWYERLAAGATQMLAETPQGIAGFIGGGVAGTAVGGPVGTIVGAGAGTFAVPTAIRESLIQAYEKGDVTSTGDFLSRAGIVVKKTAKDAAVGALTFGAGAAAGRLAGKTIAPAIGETVSVGTGKAVIGGAQVSAELGTMVVAPSLLEGQMPEPQDFMDAAVLLVGAKGAGAAAGKLRRVYAKTGIPPEQVVAEARNDPTIALDVAADARVTLKNGQKITIEQSKEGPVREADRQEVFNINTPPEKGDFTLFAKNDKGEIIGHLELQIKEGETVAVPRDVQVVDGYKRQGVATALYAQAERMGLTVKESELQTAAGKALRTALSKRQSPADDAFDLDFTTPRAYEALARDTVAREAIPGHKAEDVAGSPFAEIPQAKGEPAKPTHINYNFVITPDDVKAAHARLSEVYEAEIQAQRRGTVTWEQTSAEAGQILAGILGGDPLPPRAPGTAAGAAEMLARKQMAVGATEEMMRARDDLLRKGSEATPEDTLAFLAAIERAAMIQAEFLGARAEAGRALNILKETKRDAERVSQIQKVLEQFGKDPRKLAEMLKEIDTPEGAAKFAREATKATTWEKIVEAWKAGLVSGPITHMANVMGNTVFTTLRLPIETLAAGIGLVRGGVDRVAVAEPIARLTGLVMGTLDGLKVAAAVIRTGESIGNSKAETHIKAIEGTKGEVIRLPFRALAAEDAIFRTMNERGEAYSLAVRKAVADGHNPATREFREAVAHYVNNPDAKMQEAITAAGDRFTFNASLGDKGQAVQKFVRAWHMEFIVPFIRTPGNILKELVRMTPVAPLVKEWRQDLQKGGAAADKAMAEVIIGSSLAAVAMSYAKDGLVSGAGEPDPDKRRVKMAAGWQPYSVKVGDTWYAYNRLQPVGTLMGLAADVAEVWEHMNDEESDAVPKMMSVAFANAVTNQTFLQGFSTLSRAMAEPDRFGPKFVEQLSGSVVPGALSQTAQLTDPYMREINGIVDAIKNRVPGLRETLLPQRDWLGVEVANKERAGVISPITKTTESPDKVRSEAMRLKIGVEKAPKSIQVPRVRGELGEIKLTPEQKDVFADTAGQIAYQALKPMVDSAMWDSMPDMVKQRAFTDVITRARSAARKQTIPPEQWQAEAERIAEEYARRLGQPTGGIDRSRPIIENKDGSFSTERTITIEADGKHYLIPTIVGGKQREEEDAIKMWQRGENKAVGVFDSAEEAERVAKARSEQIGQVRQKDRQ